jgi:hypothetical protein
VKCHTFWAYLLRKDFQPWQAPVRDASEPVALLQKEQLRSSEWQDLSMLDEDRSADTDLSLSAGFEVRRHFGRRAAPLRRCAELMEFRVCNSGLRDVSLPLCLCCTDISCCPTFFFL